MVNITENGTLDFNPYVSLLTLALIGHTYCVNWEGLLAYGFSRRATYKILQRQTLLNELEALEAGARCQVHQGGNRKHTRPSKNLCGSPLLLFTITKASISCAAIPANEAWNGVSRDQGQNTHTHTHKFTHMAQTAA